MRIQGAVWLVLAICAGVGPAAGQDASAVASEWDWGARLEDYLATQTGGKWNIEFEQRERYENHTGQTFGKDPDLFTGLVRTRVGLIWKPLRWLKISGMMQDSRAPWYGNNAPNTARDPFGLHEAYVELRPDEKTGFGFSGGRRMLNYGEGRVIGTPQWSNLSRTYDHGRLWFATRRARFEALLASPVKIQLTGFSQPNLGDRVWGMYNSFADVFHKSLVEVYLLRHDQNRIGGYTGGSRAAGTDRLKVNTLGYRLAGPLAGGWKYSLEGAAQNGMVGAGHHRAEAWFSWVGRRWTVAGHDLDASVEYKFASGSRNPTDPTLSRTYDQIYPANHDKFGHEDLLGWRNLHNLRSLETFAVTKSFAVNFMYNQFWLASARDALYNSSGKAIAQSVSGAAGQHVGQEADFFGTYKYRHFTFGAGYGYFAPGRFLQKTTPGISPTYVYVFHTYTL
jgi:Alginate export